MDMVGGRKFVEVPGEKLHELPPLLVSAREGKRLDKMMDVAARIIEAEDMIPLNISNACESPEGLERRKMDLALNLVEQYLGLLSHWQWGDAVLEWIKQCETTFEARTDLRPLLRSDIWPHAGRSSFVTLLEDKDIRPQGVQLVKAVGLRLAFRQFPPIQCCSDQFLIYMNTSVAQSAYQAWLRMTPDPIAALPPERFRFEVVNTSVGVH